MTWVQPAQKGVLELVVQPIPLLIAGVSLVVLSMMLNGFDDRVAAHEFRVTGTVTRVIERDCLPLARHCDERHYLVQWQSPEGRTDLGTLTELGRVADVGDSVELVVDDRLRTPRAMGYATPYVRWARIIAGVLLLASAAMAIGRWRRRGPRQRPAAPPASPISD